MANRMPSHFDLRIIHFQHELYTRFVGKMGLEKVLSKWVISLWLWFESVGHDFIGRASSFNNDVVEGFISESIACLNRCVGRSTSTGNNEADDIALPLISSLFDEPMDLHFFDIHYDVVIKGVKYFYEKMSIVYGTEVEARSSSSYQIQKIGGGSSQQGTLVDAATAPLMITLRAQIGLQSLQLSSSEQRLALNPAASPWLPGRLHDNLRSIFITFARGFPLKPQEVEEFFTRRYGHCVESVFIERSKNGATPLYGRVVFNSVSMIVVVLNGKPTAKFKFKGRDLWARIYLPCPNRAKGGNN